MGRTARQHVPSFHHKETETEGVASEDNWALAWLWRAVSSLTLCPPTKPPGALTGKSVPHQTSQRALVQSVSSSL